MLVPSSGFVICLSQSLSVKKTKLYWKNPQDRIHGFSSSKGQLWSDVLRILPVSSRKSDFSKSYIVLLLINVCLFLSSIIFCLQSYLKWNTEICKITRWPKTYFRKNIEMWYINNQLTLLLSLQIFTWNINIYKSPNYLQTSNIVNENWRIKTKKLEKHPNYPKHP